MTITWESLMVYGGAIVLLGNVINVLYRWLTPALNTKNRLRIMEEDIETLKKHETKDLETLEHLQEINKLQCQAMLCIINHMIDNNNIDTMKATRDKIQSMFTEM